MAIATSKKACLRPTRAITNPKTDREPPNSYSQAMPFRSFVEMSPCSRSREHNTCFLRVCTSDSPLCPVVWGRGA